MKVVRTIAELRAIERDRPRGARIGFVPTMGALHEGHVALMRAARADSDDVVASVFVNPAQFNDPSDLAKYPRQEARDAEMARAAGIDTLFVPAVEEMYPDDLATSLTIGGPALGFEGDYRPGHFNGVAIVCLKLFSIVLPTVAYFGQKDAQQVAVLRQLVRDTNLPLEVRVHPTIRAASGLALSSRNARLSPEEMTRALAIPRALMAGLAAHVRGADPVAVARPLLDGLDVEYLAIAHFHGEPTLVVAARAGITRLIDNVPLNHPALAGLPVAL